MNQESTKTIYNCLGPTFWTKRKCQKCQGFFTLTDFTQPNHQLVFREIGNVKSTTSLNQAVLEGVIVELQHQQCPLTCGFSYQKDIICK